MIEAKVEFDVDFTSVTDDIRQQVVDIVTNNTLQLSQIAQANASGPAPSHLEIETGNLISTIQDNTTVTEEGDSIIGEVGSDAQSYKGFPYAQYWEGAIDQGNGKHDPWPRPFLEPSLEAIQDGYLAEMESLA